MSRSRRKKYIIGVFCFCVVSSELSLLMGRGWLKFPMYMITTGWIPPFFVSMNTYVHCFGNLAVYVCSHGVLSRSVPLVYNLTVFSF